MVILFNTVSLAIAYPNMSDELTGILDTCNLVFGGIFFVEMIIKLIGNGNFFQNF